MFFFRNIILNIVKTTKVGTVDHKFIELDMFAKCNEDVALSENRKRHISCFLYECY